MSFNLGIEIDQDVFRRVPAKHDRPDPPSNGFSWPMLLGHTKDSLRSTDLFRGESLILKVRWVIVLMDQYSRRIKGFAVHAGVLDGVAGCYMFNGIVAGTDAPVISALTMIPGFVITNAEFATDRRNRVERHQLLSRPA